MSIEEEGSVVTDVIPGMIEEDTNLPTLGHVTLEPSQNPPPVEGGIETLKQLPHSDIDFKVVDDQATKIVSLKEVEDQIQGKDKIDSFDADVINESFEGLYDHVQPKAAYTSTPTKTGLHQTKAYVRERIATEEAKMLDLFRIYLDQPVKGAQDLLAKMIEDYIPAILQTLESLSDEMSRKQVGTTNQYHFRDQNQMVNLESIDLLDVTDPDRFQRYSGSLQGAPTFLTAVSAIQSLFKNDSAFWDFFTTHVGGDVTKVYVSMQTLAAFFTNPATLKSVIAQGEMISGNLRHVNDLVEQARNAAQDPSAISKFVVEHTPQFKNLTRAITTYAHDIYTIALLAQATKLLVTSYYG